MRYRSKPSEIEAIQCLDLNSEKVIEFMGGTDAIRFVSDEKDWYKVELLAGTNGAQGWVPVPFGHWIVRQPGDLTDHWPVDPEYFDRKYEPA